MFHWFVEVNVVVSYGLDSKQYLLPLRELASKLHDSPDRLSRYGDTSRFIMLITAERARLQNRCLAGSLVTLCGRI
jgi:hypothetical protein